MDMCNYFKLKTGSHCCRMDTLATKRPQAAQLLWSWPQASCRCHHQPPSTLRLIGMEGIKVHSIPLCRDHWLHQAFVSMAALFGTASTSTTLVCAYRCFIHGQVYDWDGSQARTPEAAIE